ncbi:ribonuclease DdI [Galendromus occidentalis]|uniref:Ribonuclease DdI n=1 Tax=Galendromus occidentalis TaxID=34638 RepID=A0AAJ7PB05_9ACAR|nr:ribonuclease DdI [Galendromus occidentalis]
MFNQVNAVLAACAVAGLALGGVVAAGGGSPDAWSRAPSPGRSSVNPTPDPAPQAPPRRRRPSPPNRSSPPRSPSPHRDGSPDGSYSHLVLSLQWHGGVCADGKSDDRPCVGESKRDTWTIHGLWPSQGFSSPSYCSEEAFDGRRLEKLKGQLNQNWPSYTATQDRYFTFWRHQWQKHGTCANDVPQLNSLVKFFETTLKLAKQHDIKKYLENSNIRPSRQQTYQPQQIMRAFADDLPSKLDVVCSDFRGKSVLSEVRLCFDKSLKPIDCRGQSSRCGNQIYYLPVQ